MLFSLIFQAFKVFDFPTSVIRIMPNTPMSVGAGICLYTPDNIVKPEQCMLLEKILSSCGICEKVAEPLMNSGGVLPACGPAFVSFLSFNKAKSIEINKIKFFCVSFIFNQSLCIERPANLFFTCYIYRIENIKL